MAFAFGIFGLIIAFENIAMSVPVLVLFSSINQSLFFSFVLMMVLGIACGFFIGLGATAKTPAQEEEDF